MARVDVLDILRAKKQTPLEFEFDNLWIPPINTFLSMQDIESLRKIATSVRLSAKIDLKYKMIDDIMRNRGFKRFSAGTNRVVYSFLEDDRFVVKIAVDKVGMQDNPLEFKNQEYIKPYCAKMFYISPCGTVGFSERVLPIKNKEEFKQIAPDVFDIIVHKFLGKYVLGDIGSKYFMNWGVRFNYAPVLLDFPYCYKLDGSKLYCNNLDETNNICNGEIDYDEGFNHLVCKRCGKIYLASDLEDNSIDNKIIIKGGIQMKVILRKGDEVIHTSNAMERVMTPPKKSEVKKNGLVISINKNITKDIIQTNENENKEPDISLDAEKITVDVVHKVNEENKNNRVYEETSISDDISITDETANIEMSNKTDDVIEVDNSSNNTSDENVSEKSEVVKKPTTRKTQTKKKNTVSEEDKYAEYDADDGHSSYQPIRKRKSTENVEKTTSTKKKSSKSSTFIPSK